MTVYCQAISHTDNKNLQVKMKINWNKKKQTYIKQWLCKWPDLNHLINELRF